MALSSVVMQKTVHYQSVLIHDGVLQSNMETHHQVTTIQYKNYTLDNIINSIEDDIKNMPYQRPPAILISAGHEDISRHGIVKEYPFSESNKLKRLGEIEEVIASKFRRLNEIIKNKNGKMVIANLIPRPIDQSYEHRKGIKQSLQDFLSRLYIRINKVIQEINMENGLQTPPFQKWLEKSVKQKTSNQKKIYKTRYEADLVHPTQEVVKKIENVIYKILESLSTKSVAHTASTSD